MTEQELKEIDDIIFFIRNRNDTTDAGKAVLISLMENIRATLREREAELEKWKENYRIQCAINNAEKNHIAKLESTVARLRKALESVNRSIENGEGIDVNIVQEALSPSPSANSGEKP